ncbi:MAG: outer membrane lipid asymmetry maintenance protein MlaD [Betaproteobacteria bacterium]|nr:outer membrane lipid asymmetry maintenance protein MlaD [Betaproteobacteria bacterium]
MNKTRDRADLLAGLLIIAAACSMVFIAMRAASLGEYDDSDTYSVKVTFTNIGQLKEQSPVKSSGIIVGRIDSLAFDSEEFEAVAHLELYPRNRFPSDSSFSIVSTNLLGDQYINVEAGGADELLEDGDAKVGNSAIILEELISKFLFDKAGEEEESLL